MFEKTDLCLLAERHKSDKCLEFGHNYTPYYHEILGGGRQSFSSVLEIGIGNYEQMGRLIEGYSPGASLRMWRDYFPAATIFGCDILDVPLEEERIITFRADQNDEGSLLSMMAEISKLGGLPLDLIVDDGSHIFEHQEKSLLTLWRFLKQNGIYIIEDFSLERFSELCDLANKLQGCIVSQPSIPTRRRGGFILHDNCLVFRKT